MKTKIKELYLLYIEQCGKDELSKEMKQDILKYIEQEAINLSKEQYEKLQDVIFKTASVGEEYGFVRGFQYAVQLMKECMN